MNISRLSQRLSNVQARNFTKLTQLWNRSYSMKQTAPVSEFPDMPYIQSNKMHTSSKTERSQGFVAATPWGNPRTFSRVNLDAILARPETENRISNVCQEFKQFE
eukprot:TRINITY_DN2503_c0_g2_i1.p1 TRINITY_DN2503_c0_g2~~TRINITY_DN2503_c0_g2_i1.p1  ORF type:complete len:105 (-),score=8.85 TRINITY_DN2503_c0_g2_i1:33-347(-)